MDLESEIKSDYSSVSAVGRNKACALLEAYTGQLSSLTTLFPEKEKIACKVATILGQGTGVGGFTTKRKATDTEKSIMVQALHVAYQFYPLQDNDFFTVASSDVSIKKHQAVLWGLSKVMGIRATERMFEAEQVNRQAEAILREQKGPNRSALLEHNHEEYLTLQVLRRTNIVQICGRFGEGQQHYRALVDDKNRLPETVRALIGNAGLREYDLALSISSNLFDLFDKKNGFAQERVANKLDSLSLNTKPHSMYYGSIYDVVSVYQYNPDLGKTPIAIRRKGSSRPTLGPAVESALSRVSEVDYDLVFQVGFSDGSPYLLRPHGWTDPNAQGASYDVIHNIQAGIFESNGITIGGQAVNTIGSHSIQTHGGVASPSNIPLNLAQRNLEPTEFYPFISVVTEGGKGAVTLHGMGGDAVIYDVIRLAELLTADLTVGDLFVLMHYNSLISQNPHFLKLLVQWLG